MSRVIPPAPSHRYCDTPRDPDILTGSTWSCDDPEHGCGRVWVKTGQTFLIGSEVWVATWQHADRRTRRQHQQALRRERERLCLHVGLDPHGGHPGVCTLPLGHPGDHLDAARGLRWVRP